MRVLEPQSPQGWDSRVYYAGGYGCSVFRYIQTRLVASFRVWRSARPVWPPLSGGGKSFRTGIVITVAFGTHAAAQLVLLQQGAVSMGAILAAPVRMHDDPFGAFAFKNSHLQGITHQVGGHAFGHCPTDGLTGEQVGDDRQIQPAFVCAGWSKRQGVVGLFPCLSSPNRTCTFQRIRLSI